jgi:NAD(P)-dependent dehydrogenase (short-subunit alcohol dehydrogenase family)
MRIRRMTARTVSTILDPGIVFSYDRTGFLLHSQSFNPADLDVDLSGRRYLITGANSGLGFATAAALAARRAEVWLLCRSKARGQDAQARIPFPTHLALLDLSDLDAIRRFCDQFEPDRIDGLIHNAGILPDTYQRSACGLEMTLTTNLVGPHLLTRRLTPHLKNSDDGRLIFVSSGGMYAERLSVERLQLPAEGFDGVTAYARTKRAQVVVAERLAEELAQTSVTVSSMHPGWADTPGVQHSLPTFRRLTRKILRSAEQGADTIIWLAAAQAPRGQSGRFWFDRAPRKTHYVPWTREAPQERQRLIEALDGWIA